MKVMRSISFTYNYIVNVNRNFAMCGVEANMGSSEPAVCGVLLSHRHVK